MLTALGMLLIADLLVATMVFHSIVASTSISVWPGPADCLNDSGPCRRCRHHRLQVGVLLFGLWQVRALFLNFASGHVFTLASARLLRDFAGGRAGAGNLGPISATALMQSRSR